jgi:hypothetical protein
MANGTYGYRALTLTAAGVDAYLFQTLSTDVPKIASDYGVGAYAKVAAGGAGVIIFDGVSLAVTETSYTLKQFSRSVTTNYTYSIGINAGKTITIELPTLVLGRALPYPMYGLKEISGHQDLGFPKKGSYKGVLTNGSTIVVNIAGLAQTGESTVLGFTCYWHSASTASGGILRGTQYMSSAPAFQTPSLFCEGALSAITDSAGYVCVFASTNVITIKNALAGGAEAIRVVVEYTWG